MSAWVRTEEDEHLLVEGSGLVSVDNVFLPLLDFGEITAIAFGRDKRLGWIYARDSTYTWRVIHKDKEGTLEASQLFRDLRLSEWV